MFIGEYQHTIDSKNRVAVPFKFRKALGKGAIIAKSIDKNLTIYSRQEWQKLAEKLTNLPMFDVKAKALNRFIFSSASEVDFDHQGRMLIPGSLKKYGGFKKDLVIVGVYSKIEIWDQNAWQNEQEKSGVGTEKFEKDLKELGI